MLFKKHLILLLFILSCAPIENISNNKNIIFEDSFSNSGFTLVFSENLKEEKIIDRRLDSRSLTIFQKMDLNSSYCIILIMKFI